MWFVTLVLLAVAAYFLWDAFRDKKFIDSGKAVSAARKETVNTIPDATGNNYRNTRSLQTPASGAADSSTTAKVATAAGVATATILTTSDKSQGKPKFLEGPIGSKDDLTRIEGVDADIEKSLNNLGIYHYDQISNFSHSDVNDVSSELNFPDRIQHEKWIEQARRLSHGLDPSESSTGSASTVASGAVPVTAASFSGSGNTATDTVQFESRESMDETSDLTEADFTGAWNTDVLIEVQERLKVLNTRESDIPRLQMTVAEYRAIKDDDESHFSRDRLIEILDRLRVLG